MLLPSHVLARAWWPELQTRLQRKGAAAPVLFLAPRKHRYVFTSRFHSTSLMGGQPASGGVADDTRVTPLETIWFVGGLIPAWAREVERAYSGGQVESCVLAKTLEELPRRIRKVHVYAQRRATKGKGKGQGKGKGKRKGKKRKMTPGS
jgi:hypothetical protein